MLKLIPAGQYNMTRKQINTYYEMGMDEMVITPSEKGVIHISSNHIFPMYIKTKDFNKKSIASIVLDNAAAALTKQQFKPIIDILCRN